ncbi:MAG: ribonuclease J [Gloeocapsa sp. DLM2.Bin57]|nr:MAG: ribonuclease J [Gloeocapsa sp. DLM2.Bin57]
MRKKIDQKPTLKIIPLGGLDEIGKNTCIFEYEDELILLDAGIAFPTDEMHGVNIVLPDMSYLQENQHRIKGMIVTHGHEDHIGGIAYHLKQIDIPIIYGPHLAMNLLKDKLEEAGLLAKTNLQKVRPRDMVRIGEHFAVEFLRNTHSIADSFTIALHTPIGVVIHSGDFKFDHTPVDGEHFDIQKLAEYGEKGVLALLSDSTNAEVPGFTPSESSVYPNLDRVFSKAEGRIMLTTFASSVHRVNIVLNLAAKHGRKVGLVGRSMLNVIAHARNLGYIKCQDDLFVTMRECNNLSDDQVLILTTGSQGEPLSALTRISKGEHRDLKIRQGDTVIFSANPIPGNTIAVVNTIDRLMKLGANVVYGRNLGIHVSGHGAQEDHKLMLALTKPKFFVPVHGEYRMLIKHSETAQSMGVPKENMVIVQNGDVIELTQDSIAIASAVTSGIKLVDRAGIVHQEVMLQRQQLADDGVISVAASLDWNGTLLSKPVINFKGVVTNIKESLLQELIIRNVEKVIKTRWSDFSETSNGESQVQWKALTKEIELSLSRLIKRETQTQPLVMFLLQHPENPDKEGKPEVTKEDTKVYRRKRPTASIAS